METSPKKNIACHLQDYFEAACVYQYQLQIRLNDGSLKSGKAINLKSSKGVEYLQLMRASLNTEYREEIDLLSIKSVKVLTPNPRFSHWKM